MLAKVEMLAGEPYQALAVPKDAVINRGGQYLIKVLDAENKVVDVPVTPGLAVGNWVAVSGDLQAGARVVTIGNERVQAGQQVASASQRDYE